MSEYSSPEKLIRVLTKKSIMEEDITIYFGSCFKNYRFKDYHIFENILGHKPDLWMWTGDVVYLN
jgi:hypothetical protein